MVNLQEATEYLVANGYLRNVKGEWSLTPSFRNAMKALASGNKVAKGVQPKVYKDVSALNAGVIIMDPKYPFAKENPPGNWVESYKQFILDARVPVRCESKHGEYYYTNKYSEPGMKAFRKAIESGVKYELLVMSTALYYKSGIRLKVAIGRYMEEGLWRSDYDALVQSAEENKVPEHINSVTDDGQHSFTKLG